MTPNLPIAVQKAIRCGHTPEIRDFRSMPFKSLSFGERNCRFIEKHCKVPEGKLVGQPIKLLDFQIAFILAIYDNPHGSTQDAYLSIARKNGKTALIACLIVLHLVGEPAQVNSQIISGAKTREQATIVYNLCCKIIRFSTALTSRIKITASKKELFSLSKGVSYKAIASDAGGAMGLSPVFALIDELGSHVGSRSPFFEAIETAQGAHDSPLMMVISTQAASDADLFSTLLDDATRNNDKTTVCHVYESTKDCSMLDKSEWELSNPALNVFRSFKDLEKRLVKAGRLPSLENGARNLLLNQRVSMMALFIMPTVWKQNNQKPDIEAFKKYPVTMGLDLSQRNDLTAAVISCRDDEGFVHIIPFCFTPLTGVDERSTRDRTPYNQWIKDGFLIGIAGRTIEYGQIVEYLRDYFEDLEIDIDFVYFDRWRMTIFQAACEEYGFCQNAEFVEVGQGFKGFSPAIESFETVILNEKLKHGDHPLLMLGAANAICVSDPSGNRKLDKSKASQKIDPIVAAVMAVFGCTDADEADISDDIIGNWIG